MPDDLPNAHDDTLREVAEKYEMLNAATRDRLREISQKLQALSGELDVVAEADEGASPEARN
jgi:hypothetical protein